MTPQEIFDKALSGVINQGDLCVTDTGYCLYRHPHKPGMACGIGHLIDDDTAALWDSLALDNGHDSSISQVPVDTIPAELRPHMDLLCSIQDAHDLAITYNDPAPRLLSFLHRMVLVAQKHGLTVSVTEQDIERVLA